MDRSIPWEASIVVLSKLKSFLHFAEPQGTLQCSLLLVLRQMNPVHVITFCIYKISFSIILLGKATYSKGSLSFMFSRQPLVCICVLPHTCHKPCPSYPTWVDRLTVLSVM